MADADRRVASASRFAAALAASLLVHAGALGVLGDGSGAAHPGASSWPAVERPLEVAVLPPRFSSQSELPGRPPERLSPVLSTAARKESPRPELGSAPQRFIAQPPGKRTPGDRGLTPRVVVNDRVARARFGEALDGEMLGQFPVEVDASVVLPGKLEIPYPPSALNAKREGTVLAWVVVAADGTVEDVRVVEGDADFAAAVTDTLAGARFVPARDGGAPIRFYVTLEIEFRLGDATKAASAAR